METVGLAGNFTFKKVTWSNNYYTGPQKEGLVAAYRQLYDTTALVTADPKTTVYVNFDYGTDKQPNALRQSWTGMEAAARYQFTDRFAFAPRFGALNDRNGFATGTAQWVRELTLTGEMKVCDGVLTRLEYRRDNSDKPYFDRGAGVTVAKNQTTLTLAVIAFFGPKK